MARAEAGFAGFAAEGKVARMPGMASGSPVVIIASACDLASKRLTIATESIPGLMTFSATRRRTGSS